MSFSLGAGPVPGLLLPEIFPNKIRAKAMALCMSMHWVRVFSPDSACTMPGPLLYRRNKFCNMEKLYTKFLHKLPYCFGSIESKCTDLKRNENALPMSNNVQMWINRV